jgi:hypothetical protein
MAISLVVTAAMARSSQIFAQIPLHFHRNRAYGRSPQTARIEFSYLDSAFPLDLVFRLLPYSLSVTSGPIRETLAHDSFDCSLGTLHVIYAKADTIAIAKIVLREISVEMLLAAMLIDADHAALEDRKEAFRSIGVCVTANILASAASAMIYGLVVGKSLTNLAIDAALVNHQSAFSISVICENFTYYFCIHFLDMKRTDRTAALHQRDHLALMIGATFSVAFWPLGSDIGFVGLDYFPGTAHWINTDNAHGFAQAVRHEPCSFQGHTQGPAKLVAANALLTGGQQIHCLQPKPHRDVAIFEHGPNLNGERLTALVALINACASALALEFANAVHAPSDSAERG